uniref:SRCR domain-containing protein n=1 Tax=Neogobius melanostomus TaxID=47308 RepID=A0A8C6TT91_9GOBI
ILVLLVVLPLMATLVNYFYYIQFYSDDVRLVGGASHCEGELQVKHLNRWREVHIEDFLLLTAADSVRLLHGSSQCSGSLEVKMNQSWTLVCAEDFDLKDAEVVCRELGCGDPSLLQGTFYGEGFAPVRQMFQCEGHESALMDCPRSRVIQNNCPSLKAVLLSCLEPLRLTGGSEACAGTLELRHRAQWRPVYIPDFLLLTAAGVCRRLHCGSAISHKREDRSSHSAVKLDADCVRSSSSLSLCVRDEDFSSDRYYSIICSGTLHLQQIHKYSVFKTYLCFKRASYLVK